MEGTVDTELTGDGSGISFKQTTDSLLMLRTDFHSRLNNHNIVFFFFYIYILSSTVAFVTHRINYGDM